MNTCLLLLLLSNPFQLQLLVRSDTHVGDHVYQVILKTGEELNKLQELEKNARVDVMNQARRNSVTNVRVPLASVGEFESFITNFKIQSKLLVADVSKEVQRQKPLEQRKVKSGVGGAGKMSWDRYYNYEEIMAWIKHVTEKYPTLAKYDMIGKSFEDREIPLVTLAHPSGVQNRSTLVDCCNAMIKQILIHSREWISGAQCTYIINQLTAHADKYEDLLKDVRFYIIPILNPDGYKYTETDRWWRKNRSIWPGSNCSGTDLNRNFPFHWGEIGGSTDPCSEIYSGTSACSELECIHLTNFIKNHSDIDTYFTLHSYGEFLLSPWSYTDGEPTNQAEITPLTSAICNAISSTSGSPYTCGVTGTIFPAISGVSDDWAKSHGMRFTYTIELPPKDGYSVQCFHLAEEEILRTCKSIWTGIQVGASRKYLANSRSGNLGECMALMIFPLCRLAIALSYSLLFLCD